MTSTDVVVVVTAVWTRFFHIVDQVTRTRDIAVTNLVLFTVPRSVSTSTEKTTSENVTTAGKKQLNNQLFADDLQLYLYFKPTKTIPIQKTVDRIERGVKNIVNNSLINTNILKINADKSKSIFFF